MKVLVALNGPMEGDVFPVAGRTLIGRDGECDIQVVDRHASRRHACVLELDDGSTLLRDLKSQNGTLLRGEPIKEAVLEPGDEIEVGGCRFELRIMDEAEVRASETHLRLITGPALASTISGGVRIPRGVREASKTSAASQEGDGRCCGSPLADRARAEGWPHCPACGAALTSP